MDVSYSYVYFMFAAEAFFCDPNKHLLLFPRPFIALSIHFGAHYSHFLVCDHMGWSLTFCPLDLGAVPVMDQLRPLRAQSSSRMIPCSSLSPTLWWTQLCPPSGMNLGSPRPASGKRHDEVHDDWGPLPLLFNLINSNPVLTVKHIVYNDLRAHIYMWSGCGY